MILNVKDIPKELEKLDELQKDKNKIKNMFSRIKIDTLNVFVSINPIKIKLIIPVDMYDNDKKVLGIHPFGSQQKEVLNIKNKKDKLLYHLMDAGGYSNIPQDSESIEVIDMNYNDVKYLFRKEKIYKDLLNRYDDVVNRKGIIKVLIHNISDTVLYIKNSLMNNLFPHSYLDKEGKSIYLFNNTDMNDRFRISYRTSGKSLFPTYEGEGQLYTNLYPGRFGNNSININNVKEISSKGQKNVKLLIKSMKKSHKTEKKSHKTEKRSHKTEKNINKRTIK